MFARVFNRYLEKISCRRRRGVCSVSRQQKYEQLQSRQLLAGFNLSGGFLYIAGDSGPNNGSVYQINSITIRATLDGTYQNFLNSNVNQVVFLGRAGDDSFVNHTSIPSRLIGADGDDVLTGGSASDIVNGGRGNDILRGGDGHDLLVGADGNDRLYGGDGYDRILTGNGLNEAYGEGGNDLIYGGNDADRLDGGDHIDGIFGGNGNDTLYSGDGGVVGSTGVAQADLLLGNLGDDTFFGAGGLNVFYGGDGNDIMNAGTHENRLHGQNGNDRLIGGAAADFLAGNNGDDTIIGNNGDDFILPGSGNDTINGGSGRDWVVFTARSVDYRILRSGANLVVQDARGIEDIDFVESVEMFRFSDRQQPAISPVTRVVTIQPIGLANDNGSNPAETFGNAAAEFQIKTLVDAIYYQAGIDIQWLATTSYNNTFANVGNQNPRPTSDLATVVAQGDAAGKGSSNPLVIDMYFAEIAAGYGDTGENSVNGLAFGDDNGAMIHVGDNLPSFAAGIELVARIISHELAHNLGLINHESNPLNLMHTTGGQGILTASQMANIRDSQFAATI